MQNEKVAVVYYSISGHSRRLAEILSDRLDGELIEITVPKYRAGIWGYIRIGFDSLRQKRPTFEVGVQSFSGFDSIVLCGPVWTSFPATPLRSFLKNQADLPARVAVFLTNGGNSPVATAIEQAEDDLGRPLVASANLANTIENTPEESQRIESFLAAFADVRGHLRAV